MTIEFKESPIRDVATGMSVAYTVDTEDYGGSPTSVSVTVKNLTTGATATSSVLSGSASVSTDTITTPTITSLAANNTYAVDVVFTSGGQIYKRRLRLIVGV